jgi:hypothetical protein
MSPTAQQQHVQPQLGRLESVPLRQTWTSEALSFTPWLAQTDNLLLLGESLGLKLQFEGKETAVGPFRADILCKDLDTDTWVLIENQIERTDHAHLGQILTYAAGLHAATIIWVSAQFTDEHRAALDWLNEITDEEFAFFGVEVELWRIGDSSPAPRFNVVSKPNNWTRAVSTSARRVARGEPQGIDINRVAYWSAFGKVLDALDGPLKSRQQPPRSGYYSFTIDAEKELYLYAYRLVEKHRIGVYVALYGEASRYYFQQLSAVRDEIEQEVGGPLWWEEPQPNKKYWIGMSLDNADPLNESDWPRQHEWLAMRLQTIYRVFVPRISALQFTGQSV